jgi:hypothetical protein
MNKRTIVFVAQNKITTLPHPPYSLDLAPCDFFLFPKLKTHLKEHHSSTAMKSGSNAGIAVFDRKEPSQCCTVGGEAF